MSTNGALVAMLAGLASLGSRRRGMTDIDVVERRPFFTSLRPGIRAKSADERKRDSTQAPNYAGARQRVVSASTCAGISG